MDLEWSQLRDKHPTAATPCTEPPHETPDMPEDPTRQRDPEAIAVFDRMGGTDFPETTPKIPLRVDHAHWDGCAGHFDIMGSYHTETSTVTELTMASSLRATSTTPPWPLAENWILNRGLGTSLGAETVSTTRISAPPLRRRLARGQSEASRAM